MIGGFFKRNAAAEPELSLSEKRSTTPAYEEEMDALDDDSASIFDMPAPEPNPTHSSIGRRPQAMCDTFVEDDPTPVAKSSAAGKTSASAVSPSKSSIDKTSAATTSAHQAAMQQAAAHQAKADHGKPAAVGGEEDPLRIERAGWCDSALKRLAPTLDGGDYPSESRDELRGKFDDWADEQGELEEETVRERLWRDVESELFGFGPLDELLADPNTSEVMVNGPFQVFVERKGKLIESDVRFRDNSHVEHVIQRIVRPLGRTINRKKPTVDARMPDGSRVNAVVPPCAIDGPSITIRKFRKDTLKIDDLVKFGSLTQPMADFLKACVHAGMNIVVSGGTGSGKTTLLNILSCFIPSHERIVTIEDAAELQLQQRHVVRLETKPREADGSGDPVTIRELVINALRMRPERIVVGECRGGEALDMLQAMNTGHDGSMTTAHANTPRDCLGRLETMTLMAGMELPLKVVRTQIASAVHLIVQASRLRDGSRKITHIAEVSGMEGDLICMQNIFHYQETDFDHAANKVVGKFQGCGFRPSCIPRLEASGSKLPIEMFNRD